MCYCSTNSAALKGVYDEIIQNKATNWAVFGYQGKTNTIKLVESGAGGVEEAVEEFSGSHIQYGFIRLTDPNHGTIKYVFVSWTGEGAPPERKGVCANHVKDVSKFFPGAHVTINARSEADLDVESIKKLVAKSSGANYSVHKETASSKFSAEPSGPVSSAYTNSYKSEGAKATAQRDAFWSKQEKEEADRKAAVEAQKAAEKARVEAERIAREAEAEKHREALAAERAQAAKASAPAPAPAPVSRAPVKAVVKQPEPQPEPEPEPQPEPEVQPEPEPEAQNEPEPVAEASEGLRAVALYDYQAAEEGELTFDPEEIITDIEQVAEGWWRGSCRGINGLFPANFVQLIEQ